MQYGFIPELFIALHHHSSMREISISHGKPYKMHMIFTLQVNVLEPHPNAPILATSGLDHDIKVWMPMAQNPTTLEGLKRVRS